jgi:ABC-2 type transport system permease protein
VLSTLWTLAKNAFLEIIRQPVYAILLVIGLTLIALSPAITMFSMVQDEKLLVDMGLATILLLGVVMSVLAASQVISREIESETAGAVLSKPVGRLTFVVGKFLGVSMASLLTSSLLAIVLLAALRMGVPSSETYKMDYPALLAELAPALAAVGLGIYANYFYRWNFTSTAMTLAVPLYLLAFAGLLVIGPDWKILQVPAAVFAERHAGQVALAALLVALGVWVLSSVAVATSTRLNVVMSVIICLAVFFIGMVSQFLFGQYASHSFIARIAQQIVPNLEVFWVGDQLMKEAPFVPLPYVGVAAGYALAYCSAMVVFAAYLFERREVV